MAFPALFAAQLLLKGVNTLAKSKAARNKQKEANRASTAQLTTGQKMREDQRRAKLKLGSSLLAGVPKTTAGGAVNTNVALDPALVAELDKERTYDFASGMPNPDAGKWWDLLAGFTGGAADTAARMYVPEAGASAVSGSIPAGSPSSNLVPPGGITRTPWVDAAAGAVGGVGGGAAGSGGPLPNAALSYEDLLKLVQQSKREQAMGDESGVY